jgi:hypothetical protein
LPDFFKPGAAANRVHITLRQPPPGWRVAGINYTRE